MNKKTYLYDTENDNIFICEAESVIDPLELEFNNRINYLNPPNSTFIEPLEPKQGFNVCFNTEKDKWEYKETIKEENIENDEIKLSKEEVDAITYLMDLKNYLLNTDWYITRKIETGKEIPEDILNKRKETRDEISKLIKENKFLERFK